MNTRMILLCLSVMLGMGLVACSSGTTSPAVTFSSWGPMSGPVGTSVTVYGTGFLGKSSTVKVNGIAAPVVNGDDQSIQFNIPAGATTGPITVEGETVGTFTVT